MKLSLALLALTLATLAGCSGSGPSAPSPSPEPFESAPQADPVAETSPAATQQAPFGPADLPILADGISGQSALGVFWLVRDPNDPLLATLEPSREAAAVTQGNLHLLSIRPFMGPTHLALQGTAAGPDSTTDYTFRFAHPIAMPANLNPPSSSTQRVDLFIFDVNLALMVSGNDLFFDDRVRTNADAFPTADGYRMVGPLINLPGLGVTNGTNVFPYRLLTKYNAADPDGNYDAAGGWTGTEYLNPSGYDVIAQGATVTTTLRIKNTITTPLPLVVFAKYMDPRGGTTTQQKRANRLPSGDATGLRYFLPEASGDLQKITATVAGDLVDNSSSAIASASATVLDWDHMASKAASFPNHAAITQVAELSGLTQPEADFPQLKAIGTFAGNIATTGQGALDELATVTVPVNNVDKSFTAQAGGTRVKGLLRIRDAQDSTSPAPTLLDEELLPQGKPSTYEVTTRYQALSVLVMPGLTVPVLTGVNPTGGASGASVTFVATNTGGAPTSWSWNFGGGASPNTSTAASPSVTLGAVGSYSASVTATNGAGPSTFNFTLAVGAPAPNITAVTPLSGTTGAAATFNPTNIGGAPTTWAWNFGGGASPNTSTAAAPNVTLGAVGSYSASVTASNASGSDLFNFTLVVNPVAPNVTAVTPTGGNAGASVTFNPTNTGGVPTTWAWNFGGGAAPNTSTAAAPSVTLGSAGSYSASVTASNSGGSDLFNFTLVVNGAGAPVLSQVTPLTFNSRRVASIAVTASNSPTSYSWNLGGAGTPNTPTTVNPSITWGNPGTYNGSVTATNASGTSAPFNFQVVVTTKKVGLRMAVITNGATYPQKLIGMSAWDLPGVQGWVATKVNPLFVNAGIEIDLNQITVVPTNNPSLFNIDTSTEENTLWGLVLGQSSTKINAYVINSQPNAPGLGGVMSDTSCNQNNSGRGCYIIPFNQSFDNVVLPHELGHIMNLPHIRTDTTPLTAQNNNLMSYGTLNTSLSSNITREDSALCICWSGNPMDQFQVVNNWIWGNF